MSESINVLSLFDGISCGQVALKKQGIKIKQYYASEVDKNAIKVTQHNHPDTIQLGDVRNIDVSNLPKIDLLIGGSPCQNFSMIGKRNGMTTKCNIQITSLEQYIELKNNNFEFEGQSYLFWEYVNTLQKLKEVNPNIKFLLENVVMKKEYLKIFNAIIGCEPIKINSSLVSGQSRTRLYWTNIADNIDPPTDRNVRFFDLIEKDVLGNYTDEYINHKKQQKRWGNCIGKSEDYKVKKHPCLLKIGKFDTLLIEDLRRFITPIEAERLQTLPDNYTQVISDSNRYAALGNGWTVDVIAHIFSYLQ